MVIEEKVTKVTIDKNGKRYVFVNECGVHPINLLTGGVVLTKFETSKNAKTYISIEELIKYYKGVKPSLNGVNKDVVQENINFFQDLLSWDLIEGSLVNKEGKE